MQRHVARFPVVRYGIAVSCVAAVVILALWLQPFALAAAQLLLVAVFIAGWVSGLRPALVAWLLATLALAYFFTPPFYSLRLELAAIPRVLIFALMAAFLGTMSATRRQAQDALTRARDGFDARVRERTTKLGESERRYRHIFDSTGVSIWEEDLSRLKLALDDLAARGVHDLGAYFTAHPEFVDHAIGLVKVVDVNDASVRLFAAGSKEELIVSLPRVLVPETRAAFENALIAIAEGRRSFTGESVLQTLKGQRLTVLFTVTFPPPDAPFTSVLVTITDITERQRAEYLTGHVFEASPDAIWIVGRDYRYQRVNAVFERRWRLPAEKIVGMRMDEVAGSVPFEETYRPNLERCFAGEEVSFVDWFPTPAGRQYLVATYSPLRPDSGRVEAVLGITRDLTEHARAQEALQRAQAELAHVTRVTTLGELAASISHEINQPLAAIAADANASLNWLAKPEPALDMVREALVAVVNDAHRAADVIQRIRQLATKTEPQRARLDVNDVIRDVVPLVRAELLAHQVSLRVDPAPGSASVLGDRIQLQQVLINLVMNGMEAMASVGDRPRELMIRSWPDGEGQVRVAVEDAGVGIDPNSMTQLFNAFFTTKPDGMGMGLSISRSIIEGHGGRLWATPNAKYGATFHFALPALR
jgi:PAS domain S-box-containing protein